MRVPLTQGVLLLLLCTELLTADKIQRNERTGAAIGIDFGASHIRVGVLSHGKVTILKNEQGRELTPSYVAFTASGHRLIGDEAKSQLNANSKNTVFSVLPLLGRNFDDDLVQDHIKQVPYSVFSSMKKPAIDVQVGDHTESFAPEEIVAMLLRKMKEIAEKHLNETVTSAVVSIPSCITYVQRRAMRDAGKIAGLNEIYVVNSHMATALAYYLNADKYTKKRILVFDLGGSSLTLSVISISNGTLRTEKQRGNCNLGGHQFEQRVMEQMVKLFGKLRGEKLAQKLRQDTRALQKLRREVDKAVRLLSSVEIANVEVDSLIDGWDFSQTLTRARFEELNIDLFRLSLDMVQRMFDESIDEILIVGGSSRIPMIRQHLMNVFVNQESKIRIDPDTSSAIGAAFWAGILHSSLGSSTVLRDTCSQSFSHQTASSRMQRIIATGDPIPAINTHVISLHRGEEPKTVSKATLLAFEGDSSLAVNSSFVGSVSVIFPPTLSPQLAVIFSIDDRYSLQVSVIEMTTGVKHMVTFEHGLSQLDTMNMRQRLQTLCDSDRWESKRLEARDDLESLAHLMKRLISKGMLMSGRVKTADLRKAESAAVAAIEWLERNSGADADEFLMKKRQLMLAVEKFKL